jgi:hypothetical protein
MAHAGWDVPTPRSLASAPADEILAIQCPDACLGPGRSNVTHIERRLERLEAQNSRLRTGMGAIMAAGAAVFLLGASSGDVANVITARRIEIVDSAGRPVVALGQADGHGFVALLDALGNFKVHLAEQIAGGTIAVKGQRNEDLVVLGYDAGGNGNVRTASASGNTLVSIGAGEGAGAVITYDNGAREHVKIGTTHSGAGALTTFAADGARLVSMTATTTGDGLVAAFDRNGGVRASWP